jgi:O-antigen ligase
MYKRQTIHSHLISTFYFVTVPVPTQIFKMKVTIIFVLIAAVFVLTASAFSIAEQGKFNTFLYLQDDKIVFYLRERFLRSRR